MSKIKRANSKKANPRAIRSRVLTHQITSQSLLEKVQAELKSSQSYLNLVIGVVIVLAVGFLVFNYFKTQQSDLIPAQQITGQTETVAADVSPEGLPGKYTVKEGDTLFTIAQRYYNDGFKYSQLVAANKLTDENTIEVGQVLDIPKLGVTKLATATEGAGDTGTGGATNQTIWGEKITASTYTVAEGDWLSTIAGRAYGDVMLYTKIATANNIVNPDVIEPGTVLQIPR